MRKLPNPPEPYIAQYGDWWGWWYSKGLYQLGTKPRWLFKNGGMNMAFDFREFSKMNRTRCESHDGFAHRLDSWSLSDWMVATMGELGEAANILKKLNRVRDDIPGNGDVTEEELHEQFADELADAFIYLDLMAQAAGIDFPSVIKLKFAKTSQKIGYQS